MRVRRDVGHVAEIGGKAVGSFAANATEVYQEGLRMPPVKLVSRGENHGPLAADHAPTTAPRGTPGATSTRRSAPCGSPSAASIELLDRYGAEFVAQASEELMDYSERWMRSEISAIPDGSYEFTDWMEDDGVVDKTVRFHVTVTIDGDRMIVDWTGSAPQVRGPINATYGVTAGAVYNAVFHLTDSAIPKNSGAYRPIYIIAPPGSVTDVVYPGPSVGGNTETHPEFVDMVTGALAPVMREKVAAAEGASACNFLFGGVHPKTGEFYANYHLEGCGWGGQGLRRRQRLHDRGRTATAATRRWRSSRRAIRWETVEYSLIQDSGDAGRHRGGLGTRRVMRIGPRVRRSPRARSSTGRRGSSGPGAWRVGCRAATARSG